MLASRYTHQLIIYICRGQLASTNRLFPYPLLGLSSKPSASTKPKSDPVTPHTAVTSQSPPSSSDTLSFERRRSTAKKRRKRHAAERQIVVLRDNDRSSDASTTPTTEHTTLAIHDQKFIPISRLSGPAGPRTQTRWDAAASTLLRITDLFLRNLPEVKSLHFIFINILHKHFLLFGPHKNHFRN